MPTSINWAVNSLNVNLLIKRNQQRSLLLLICVKYYGADYDKFREKYLVDSSYDYLENLLRDNDIGETWLPWGVFDFLETMMGNALANRIAKTYHDLSEKLLGGTDNGR